jgi:hypothetical protein
MALLSLPEMTLVKQNGFTEIHSFSSTGKQDLSSSEKQSSSKSET